MTDISYDADAGVYQTSYDEEQLDELSYTIVEAVCSITGDDPTAVPPLYESVDPDALEAIIRSFQRSDTVGTNNIVEFTLHGCLVTVYANGTVELRPEA